MRSHLRMIHPNWAARAQSTRKVVGRAVGEVRVRVERLVAVRLPLAEHRAGLFAAVGDRVERVEVHHLLVGILRNRTLRACATSLND
eukprot:4952524-Prymnesium_polylepis.1